jgi:hypothetical protein
VVLLHRDEFGSSRLVRAAADSEFQANRYAAVQSCGKSAEWRRLRRILSVINVSGSGAGTFEIIRAGILVEWMRHRSANVCVAKIYDHDSEIIRALRLEYRGKVVVADRLIGESEGAAFAHFGCCANCGAVGSARKQTADADAFYSECGKFAES